MPVKVPVCSVLVKPDGLFPPARDGPAPPHLWATDRGRGVSTLMAGGGAWSAVIGIQFGSGKEWVCRDAFFIGVF